MAQSLCSHRLKETQLNLLQNFMNLTGMDSLYLHGMRGIPVYVAPVHKLHSPLNTFFLLITQITPLPVHGPVSRHSLHSPLSFVQSSTVFVLLLLLEGDDVLPASGGLNGAGLVKSGEAVTDSDVGGSMSSDAGEEGMPGIVVVVLPSSDSSDSGPS